jgi:ABC-2 type transport system permease protein
MHYLRLLNVFFRTSIQTDMEYRADFFTRIVTSLLSLLTTIGALSIAYHYTDAIKGWTFAQALVLVAVYYLMDGLIETLVAPNMRAIMSQIRDGTLDFVLLKPVSAQFMATFRSLNIWRVINVLVGIILCTYTITRLSLTIGLLQALAFAITMAAGMAVVYSFWLFLVTLCFWFVRVDNIEQIIWQAYSAARYPIQIYPRWLQLTLTYIIPVAFIITIPAEALTGRLNALTVMISILVAMVALVLSSAFWHFGLKHYTGASA